MKNRRNGNMEITNIRLLQKTSINLLLVSCSKKGKREKNNKEKNK